MFSDRNGLILAVLVILASAGMLTACGEDGDGTSASSPVGDGITKPIELKPFRTSRDGGPKPDLPRRIAFAMDNDREFAQGVRHGLEAAADERDLDFVSANSNGDASKNVQQMQQFLAQGVGAMFVLPIDPAAQEQVMRQAIDKGVAVMTGLLPPSTLQVNTDQYETGRVLGDDAARYIDVELDGRANVVILNQDSVEALRPRFRALRDALKAVPGAEVVADIEPSQTQKDSAFRTMSTILQKSPQVDVVLGADSVVLGAYAALKAANEDNPRQYLGGIDGEPEALAEIRRGGPYKATVALAPSIFAYAAGLSAADWLEGESIPQAIDLAPVLVNSPAAVREFEQDQQNPAQAYADQATRGKYLKLLGDISYETRGDYLAYVFTP